MCAAASDGFVLMFGLPSARPLRRLRCHTDMVLSLAFVVTEGAYQCVVPLCTVGCLVRPPFDHGPIYHAPIDVYPCTNCTTPLSPHPSYTPTLPYAMHCTGITELACTSAHGDGTISLCLGLNTLVGTDRSQFLSKDPSHEFNIEYDYLGFHKSRELRGSVLMSLCHLSFDEEIHETGMFSTHQR